MLRAAGLRSSFVVPIHVEKRLWGCLGLNRSNHQGDWTESEIRALKLAARGLGTVLAQAKAEDQFRELAGNIRAVFGTSESDGRSRDYVSPAYEPIWGRSLKELQEDPESWKSSIHAEDVAKVESGLAKRGEFDLEYRLVLADRSIRWIHDRGFPVRKEGGEVSKVVGIAEDISAQKKAEEKIRGTILLLTTLIDNLGSGIPVEDDDRRVRHVNQSFCKLFEVPAPRDSLIGTDSRLLVSKSKSFADRIEAIRKSRIGLTGEELELEDLIFKRDYVPLSINELVSNSLKYAFPNDRPGLISIRLSREGPSSVRLVIRDNGVGLPPNFDLSEASSLGLKLVNGLTQQIGGTVLLKNDNGTEFDIKFPLNGQSLQQG